MAISPKKNRNAAADAAAFARVYDDEMPRLYRYIRLRVGNAVEAQHLTSDVFQRAKRQWSRVQQSLRSPRTWLFSLATARLTDHPRQRQNRAFPLSAAKQNTGANRSGTEEPAAAHQDKVTALLEYLAKLPERDRTVLALHFSGELDVAEIASVLGVSERTASLTLLCGLRQLHQAYEEGE